MATLVCFHAHPDDEAISTGGSMARAAAEGHRVVLVVATGGEFGETPDDLAAGETLVDRRRAETDASAAALGIHRVAWLGYVDSGMTGWEQNANPLSFHQAPLDDAAERLATVLREEQADVLTVYDWHGNYGHPDHIKVHTVGHRAGQLAGTRRVLEATMNRDAMRRWWEQAKKAGLDVPDWSPDDPADDGNPMGTAEENISLAVDVSAFVGHKRRSISAHRSQVSDAGLFSTMPDEVFAANFGTEWFIDPATAHPLRSGWLFE